MASEGRPRLSCRSYGWNQYRLFDGTINGPTEEGLCTRLTATNGAHLERGVAPPFSGLTRSVAIAFEITQRRDRRNATLG